MKNLLSRSMLAVIFFSLLLPTASFALTFCEGLRRERDAFAAALTKQISSLDFITRCFLEDRILEAVNSENGIGGRVADFPVFKAPVRLIAAPVIIFINQLDINDPLNSAVDVYRPGVSQAIKEVRTISDLLTVKEDHRVANGDVAAYLAKSAVPRKQEAKAAGPVKVADQSFVEFLMDCEPNASTDSMLEYVAKMAVSSAFGDARKVAKLCAAVDESKKK